MLSSMDDKISCTLRDEDNFTSMKSGLQKTQVSMNVEVGRGMHLTATNQKLE